MDLNAVSEEVLVLISVSRDSQSPEEQLLGCRLLVYSLITGAQQDSYMACPNLSWQMILFL
jgi:hypothetical protein